MTARDWFERALEIDSTYRVVFQHLVQDYVLTDDLEAGRRLVRRFKEELTGDPAVLEAEVILLPAQRRLAEAVEAGSGEVSGRGATQMTPQDLTLSEGPTRMPQDDWPVLEIPALFDQARLLEATGNGTAAERRYREFLSHWGDADVEPPSVAEARRRLRERGS